MSKKLINATAKIIRKCYSRAALEDVARELGATVKPDSDIFQSLVDSGRAADFGQAVEIIAAHLENDAAQEPHSAQGD